MFSTGTTTVCLWETNQFQHCSSGMPWGMISGHAGPLTVCSERKSEALTHHYDLLDGADNAVHERLELHVVIEVVGVADTHEEEVCWQPGDHVDHHSFGLQVCEQHHRWAGQGFNQEHEAHRCYLITQDDVLNEPGLVFPLVLQHAQVLFGDDGCGRPLGCRNKTGLLTVKNWVLFCFFFSFCNPCLAASPFSDASKLLIWFWSLLISLFFWSSCSSRSWKYRLITDHTWKVRELCPFKWQCHPPLRSQKCY